MFLENGLINFNDRKHLFHSHFLGMRLVILLLLLVICVHAFGQKYEMGINVGPAISYRTAADSGDPIAISIQNGEKGIYTFDFGLDLRRTLSNKLKVGIGVWYSQKGFSNTNVGITYDDLTLFNKVVQIDFIQNYIEVPLLIYYKLNKTADSHLYTFLGYNNSVLFSQKNNVIFRIGEINKEEFDHLSEPYLENSTRYNPGILLGFGWQRPIDDKYSFGLEPGFKILLSPLKEDRFMTHRKLYSLVLNFRFVRKL